MAERTGIPEFDALIERFAAAHPEFRDPSGMGPCVDASELLVEAARDDGIRCGFFEGGSKQNQFAPTIPNFGYEDSPVWVSHTAVVLLDHEHEFLVDFTAAQFGYREFPLVQRRGPDDTWQHTW